MTDRTCSENAELADLYLKAQADILMLLRTIAGIEMRTAGQRGFVNGLLHGGLHLGLGDHPTWQRASDLVQTAVVVEHAEAVAP